MSVAEILRDLIKGGIVTIELSAGAWLVSVAVGLLFATVYELGSRKMRMLIASVITVLRSVPQLVVLYFVYFGLGALGVNIPPITSAILALGITDAAFTAEYCRAGLLTVPQTQTEAGLSLGLSRLKVFWLIVLPQAVIFAVPPLLNAFVGLLKMATLAAAVGSPEILYRGQSIMQLTGQTGLVIAVIIVLYVAFTLPLSRAVAALERWMRVGAPT